MRLCIALITSIILGACSPKGNASPTAAQSSSTSDIAAELPLPAVPDSLRQPADRATYLLSHFWDAMDFTDTALTRNEEFMGRNFANFVNLYPHAIVDSIPGITRRFLLRATADPESRANIYDIMVSYLSDPESPVCSEPDYILFLDEWVNLPALDSYELTEPRYRLAAALRNREGTVAADFDYRTAQGESSSLHRTKGRATILLFYDPDCDHCMEVIGQLRADANLNKLIDRGTVTVLAVYTESDNSLWEATAATMPQNWIVATDLTRILDNELYDIPQMPGIYLLNHDKTVLLRQPTPDTLLKTLATTK